MLARMNPAIWETMLTSLPNLSVFVVFTWYLAGRLKRCEEGRDIILAENKDLAVRVARLEEKHSHDV